MDVPGKHVLVIGTQVPWIEAILLEMGVKKITILGISITVNSWGKLEAYFRYLKIPSDKQLTELVFLGFQGIR